MFRTIYGWTLNYSLEISWISEQDFPKTDTSCISVAPPSPHCLLHLAAPAPSSGAVLDGSGLNGPIAFRGASFFTEPGCFVLFRYLFSN